MKFRIYLVILILLTVSTAVTAVAGVAWMWVAGQAVAMLVTIALLYRSVAVPLRAVQNGMYLLREQDFSSRLRHTGQTDADKVVDLYNGLIESMKSERLKTMEQNRFLNLVVDASPLGIAICDFAGDIVQVNPAWKAMMTPRLMQAVDNVELGQVRTIRLADALIVRISKLWFMDSGFRRTFILVERLTDEIAEAEKQMFNKIVRTIGHEVNNTIGGVISVLQSLAEIHAGDSLTAAAIDSSELSCANLVKFVRGYADIVKLPAPAPEHVDLSEWLTGVMPTLRALAPDNVVMKYIPFKGACPVSIDGMLMERVLINIVKNAVESIGARPDGRIEISVSIPDGKRGSCLLEVSDNGSGISRRDAEKLFTPFFSSKRPDRGLGLMLIADILRAHRFRFSLATSVQSDLTTFAISAPLHPNPDFYCQTSS